MAKVIERVERKTPAERVVVEFFHPGHGRWQQVVVGTDPKGGIDLKVQERSGQTHCESWFLTREAAEGIWLALAEYYGFGR